MKLPLPIGGFLPLALPQATRDSLLARWLAHGPAAYFHNARAALAWLVEASPNRRLWLPAYACRSLCAARDVRFYPLQEGALSGDARFLRREAASGDVVVGIDYFGAPPERDFLELARERTDLWWVEDRAQAADPGVDWGDFLLYSPRKLLGVPDGGIMVARNRLLPPMPDYKAHGSFAFIAPSLMRLADAEETRNASWYARYQEAEDAMTAAPLPMHDLTRFLLDHTEAGTIFARRMRNWRYLAERLSEISFLPVPIPAFIPFGYPIRVPHRDQTAGRLAEARIFAATHWRDLPSDSNCFAAEHRLASEELTLPCDQRYGEAEMQLIVEAVNAAL